MIATSSETESSGRLILGMLALLMGGLVFSAIRWGVGMTPDSMVYVTSARALADHFGIELLPARWPPLFPATLALAATAFGNVLVAGRWLNSIAGALNLLLAAQVFRRCGIGTGYAWVLALLLALQPSFLHIHLFLFSEPLFLVVALLDILLLERLLREPGRKRWLLLLALACATAILFRYAGLFLLGVNAAAILALPDDSRKPRQRWASILWLSMLSVLPFVCWLLFNLARGAGAVSRALAWHPPGRQHFEDARHVIAAWFHLPNSLGVVVLAVVVLAAGFLLIGRRWTENARSPMRAIVSLYALGYLAFLALSISFADYQTPLDERILFPVMPLVLAVLASAVVGVVRRPRATPWLMAAMMVLLMLNLPACWRLWNYSRAEGFGFTGRAVQEMPVLNWLRQVPKTWPVLTNGPEIFPLYLDREAKMLPAKFEATSRRINPSFASQLNDETRNARLTVYFLPIAFRTYLPTPEELARVPGNRLVYRGDDALIWYQQPRQ